MHFENSYEFSKPNNITARSAFELAVASLFDISLYRRPKDSASYSYVLSLLRKEVIQPHLPIRLPCYDFTLITGFTFDCVLLAVRLQASGPPSSHGVTGGVYKARERIHRSMLICDY